MVPLIRDEIHDLTCPICWKRLKLPDSLTEADHAKCESCGRAFDVKEFGYAGIKTSDWPAPPDGVSVEQLPDGFRVTAHPSSLLKVLPGLLVVALMVYLLAHSKPGKDGPPLWIFLIPAVGTIPLWVLTIFNLFGQYVVSVQAGEATIFSGIGGVGWTRRFRWSDLTQVTLLRKRNGKHILRVIELACPGSKRLGRELKDEQRAYVAAYLAERIGKAR